MLTISFRCKIDHLEQKIEASRRSQASYENGLQALGQRFEEFTRHVSQELQKRGEEARSIESALLHRIGTAEQRASEEQAQAQQNLKDAMGSVAVQFEEHDRTLSGRLQQAAIDLQTFAVDQVRTESHARVTEAEEVWKTLHFLTVLYRGA